MVLLAKYLCFREIQQKINLKKVQNKSLKKLLLITIKNIIFL